MDKEENKDVKVRVSVAVPSGYEIFTNYGCITGLKIPGKLWNPPKSFDTVHLSSEDYPKFPEDFLKLLDKIKEISKK